MELSNIKSTTPVKPRPFERFSEYQAEFSLAGELPYWDIFDEVVILSDGTLATGLKLRGIALETLDSERINQMTLEWRSVLNSLPDGMEVGILHERDSDLEPMISAHEQERVAGMLPQVRWLSDHRIASMRAAVVGEALFKTSLYLFLYRRHDGESSGIVNSIFKSFFSKPKRFQEIRQKEHDDALKELQQTRDGMKQRLMGAGIPSENLSGESAWQLIYRFMNPKRARTEPTPKMNVSHREQEFIPEELKKIPALVEASPREQLVFSTLIQGYDSFYLDRFYHRIVTLKTLPEFTHSALMGQLQGLPFPHRTYVHIKVPEQSKELSDLQGKRRMAHSMSMSTDGRVSDLESESKLQATEELLRELINTGQKIFYFQVAVYLKAQSKDELDLQTKATLSKIRELNGAEGMAETVATFKIWKTLLPFGNTTMVRPKRVKTNNLADFLPLYAPYCGPKEPGSKPVCLFQSRSQGLISYDPFDAKLPNYNTLVTGSSGAGKSFLNNLVLLQYVTRRPYIYIIDVGGSYRKMCEFLGGQYIEVTPPRQGEACKPINPFELPEGQVEPSPQKLKFLLAMFESIMTDEDGDKLAKLDKSLLEEALVKTYATAKGKGHAAPTISDFLNLLSKSDDLSLKNFAKMLYPWTGNRPYGRLLDAKNELDLKSDVVVFDLKGLSSYPDLQSVMILIITDFILGKIESKGADSVGRRKQILMDEAWELLKTHAASSFMEYCARTLRKTGSGITFITQGLEEIVASPIGSAILSNTATKFILLQRGDLDPIRKILKLNDQEMALISSLGQLKGKYSEAFLMANEDRAVIRACPTPLEYWLATSDPADNALLEEMRAMAPTKNLSEHIHHLAMHYPQGAAAGKTATVGGIREPK